MELTVTARDVEHAENYLAANDIESALPMLQELAGAVEDWASEECADTEHRQWFSFDDAFERLAYRRIEKDPRELVQIEVPIARLYAALGFGWIRSEEWDLARGALMQAVRWNPMNSNYRLDLAEVFRAQGDTQEWAALSYSVVERASDGVSVARAYANLGRLFLDEQNWDAAAACSRLADALAAADPRVARLHDVVAEHADNLTAQTDEELLVELANQGIPTSPSAEIAICLLMCASDAARAGDMAAATTYTIRARDLVGEDAAKVLIQLIHESDAELAQQKGSE